MSFSITATTAATAMFVYLLSAFVVAGAKLRSPLNAVLTSGYYLLLAVSFCIVALDMREASLVAPLSMQLMAFSIIASIFVLLALTATSANRSAFAYLITVQNGLFAGLVYANLMANNSTPTPVSPFGAIDWKLTSTILGFLWGAALLVAVVAGMIHAITYVKQPKNKRPGSRRRNQPETTRRTGRAPNTTQNPERPRAPRLPDTPRPGPVSSSPIQTYPDELPGMPAAFYDLPAIDTTPKPQSPPTPKRTSAHDIPLVLNSSTRPIPSPPTEQKDALLHPRPISPERPDDPVYAHPRLAAALPGTTSVAVLEPPPPRPAALPPSSTLRSGPKGEGGRHRFTSKAEAKKARQERRQRGSRERGVHRDVDVFK